MISEESDPLQGFLSQEAEKAKGLFLQSIRRDFYLHVFFWVALFCEAIAVCFLLVVDPISWWMAATGALLLFTLFSYLTLRVYFVSEKRSRFQHAEEKFLQGLRAAFDGEGTTLEERRFVAEALVRSSKSLEGEESHVVWTKWPAISEKFAPFFWHDLYTIRESLLLRAIEEEIERVKLSPLHPDLHIALANSYVLLGELYKNEKRGGKEFLAFLQKKFASANERALLEFKILKQYDPKDPWILFQLAYTLGELGLKDEELKAYEEASRLRPHDLDALQKLGCLYFQSGRALEGLEIFDKLRRVDRERAEELIAYYH